LLQLFTQNIDCLENRAGVPRDLIVEAHGSFATQRCIDCGRVYPGAEMKEKVQKGLVPRCGDDVKGVDQDGDAHDDEASATGKEGCGGLVKPDIVFFGESLPPLFRERAPLLHQADILLIIGTSLSVHPFAGLPAIIQDHCPRVLFNLERVGGIGTKADDVAVLQDCDSGIRQLADALGWRDELEAEWRKIVGKEEAHRQSRGIKANAGDMESELEKITERVEKGLTLGEDDEERNGKNTQLSASTSVGLKDALSGHLAQKAEAISRLPSESTQAAQAEASEPGSEGSMPKANPESHPKVG
jgi:NAD-dependent histone deacetylase SIR2